MRLTYLAGLKSKPLSLVDLSVEMGWILILLYKSTPSFVEIFRRLRRLTISSILTCHGRKNLFTEK